MELTVSTLSIGMMLINIAFGFVAPAYIYFRVKKRFGCESKPLWVGCAVYIILALILENMFNNAVMTSSMGELVNESIFSYGVYSGFMAGLFENVGRFLAFRLLKKYHDNDSHALIYAAGHGGFDMFILFVLPMVSYMSYAVAMNGGNTQTLFENLDETQAAALTTTLTQLSGTSPFTFLLNLLERAAAMAVQLAMSVLVWFAAKKKEKRTYLLFAIVLHTAVNSLSVIISGYGMPHALCVLILCAVSTLYALLTLRIWKKEAMLDTTEIL